MSDEEKEKERERAMNPIVRIRFDLDLINNSQPIHISRFKAMNPIVCILLRFDLDFN